MNSLSFLVFTGVLVAVPLYAGSRSSANYRVPADTSDAGGCPAASARYANDGSMGSFGGISTAALPGDIAKHGYLGQLYEVSSLLLAANPTNLNEGASAPLAASAFLDDASIINLSSSSIAWSVAAGPISSITPAGLATAGHVYEDTLATVLGRYQSSTGSLGLLVRNVGNDDYGSYAGDGLDDAWQVAHFGIGNPAAAPGADPDADGQNNAYEFLAGSDPADGNSYFRLRIELPPGQPTHRWLIFSPRVAGRTYAVQSTLDLNAAGFVDLPGPVSDVGPERTVTDLNATETNKCYRVKITMP